MRNAGLGEAQAGITTARRNINNLRYVDDDTLMAESEEELKSLLIKVKVSHRNSRNTTWFPPLGKMRPLPATASQGKSPVPP